jgi:hypothetical protein
VVVTTHGGPIMTVGEVAVAEILVVAVAIAAVVATIVAALKRVDRDLNKQCVLILLILKIQRVQIPPRIKKQYDEFFIV